MRITDNFRLRACFDSGMQIVGDGAYLQWMGTDKQRKNANMLTSDYIDLKKQEAKEREYINK